MVKSFVVKIKYNTFLRLKRVFPSIRGESMADYFQRLVIRLEHMEYDLIPVNNN